MADATKLLSLQNLADYDVLIKKYITDADAAVDAKSIKTVLWDSTNEKIKFYKKQNATLSDTADYEVAISSSDVANLKNRVGMDSTLNGYQSKSNLTDIVNVITGANTVDGSIAKAVKDAVEGLDAEKSQTAGADGLALSISEVDGKITSISGSIAANTYDAYGAASTAKSEVIGASTDAKTADTVYGAKAFAKDAVDTLDGTLATVAKSGKAADVAVADEAGKITATSVEGALLEIVNKADANATAITTINGEGEGSIKKAVKDLKESLDKADAAVDHQFVTAVSEEDGVITVSRAALTADDIPTLTLAKISDAGTAAAKAVATTAIAEESEDASLVTAAQVAKFVKDEVADLSGAMHFRGVFDKLDDVTNPKAGDVAIVGVKEYVYGGTPAAWKELGDESIYVTKTTTIAGVDLENDITKAEMLTALNVADGAQVNVLEGVKVNGTELTITDKKVDVTVATGATNGTVAVNGVDVAVKGLGSAAYTDATAYDAAGTAQTKIEALDATVTTVTEADPTPVVNISITETDGKLTDLTASIKENTFEAYGTTATEIGKLGATVSQASSETNPVSVQVVEANGVLTSVSASVVTAATTDINALFTTTE